MEPHDSRWSCVTLGLVGHHTPRTSSDIDVVLEQGGWLELRELSPLNILFDHRAVSVDRGEGNQQLTRASDDTIPERLHPVQRNQLIAPDEVHFATFDDITLLGVIHEEALASVRQDKGVVAEAVLLAVLDILNLVLPQSLELIRKILVDYSLLHLDGRRAGSVQTPDSCVRYVTQRLDGPLSRPLRLRRTIPA